MIASIHALRGYAAILIVILHCSLILTDTFGLILSAVIGVDIFFVISGFVMWHSSRDAKPFAFVRNRIIRVVPAYWLITLAMALVNVEGGLSFTGGAPTMDVLRSLFFIAYVPEGGEEVRPILDPGWTLNLEMFFYAIFACILLAPPVSRLPLICAVLTGIVLAGGVFNEGSIVQAFYTSGLLLEFLAGILLCIAWTSGLMARARLPIMPCIAIILSLTFLSPDLTGLRFIDKGIPALLIVTVAMMSETILRRMPRFISLLGDASYAIYLIHIPVLIVLDKLAGAGLVSPPGSVLFLNGLLGSIAAGIVLHKVFEVPMNRVLRSARMPWIKQPMPGK